MKLQIIVGSVRKNSQGSKVGAWIASNAQRMSGVQAELLDLHDWDLPLYNEALPPLALGGAYTNKTGSEWAAKIASGDAYVFVTPEYNHGYSAAIKNAIDWIGSEWAGKPAAIVGYSMAPGGGVLGVEQLKPVLTQVKLMQLSHNVLVRAVHEAFDEDGQPKDETLTTSLTTVLGDLVHLQQKLSA